MGLLAERIGMVKRSTFGICQLCQARLGKVAIIRAQAPGARMFWLDIAATPDAKLKGLDDLLRRIWLA